MGVNIKRDAADVDIDAAEYQPLLNNLQANILRPHGRDNVRHIFIAFTSTPQSGWRWLNSLLPKIISAHQQYEQIKARAQNPGLDGGTIVNVYLSAAGYAALGFDPDEFDSDSFERGMKNPTGGKDPPSSTWELPFRQEIHALVAVADDSFSTVNTAADAIIASLTGVGKVRLVQEGTTLRRPIVEGPLAGKFEPIEHFGYFDGISNPIFTKRDIQAENDKTGPDWDATARLNLVLRDDPFTTVEDAYGSFLVYRKLHQDVGLFESRVIHLAQSIPLPANLTGAMVVGRFKDGTPVAKHDAPKSLPTNNFNYKGDDAAFKCPAHAHTRKVNPRESIPGPAFLTGDGRKRRIVRRGIPYGKPVPGLVEPSIPSDANRSADRGLLFLCFQANIKTQFEFIQRTWADNPKFPNGTLPFTSNTGYDPVIGQDSDEGQRWPNKWGDENAGRDRISFEAAVSLKGGEYFFAPSLAFLKALA